MAKQVGPQGSKPGCSSALRARRKDEAFLGKFHTGPQAYRLHNEAGYKSAAVSLMPSQLFTCQVGRRPYKTNKNDARDAEAICEAVARPNMRSVALKSVEQQTLLGLHRARQGFVSARTAQSN